MKKIGLVGGLGWESTVEYYRIINQMTTQKLGGIHSAEIVLVSLDLQEIADLQESGDWQAVGAKLSDAVKTLQQTGAEMVLLCSNTVHKVADEVAQKVDVPMINLIDVVGSCLKDQGLTKVALLGTRFTMADGFYQQKLGSYGITAIVPDEERQAKLHQIIFDPEFLSQKRDQATQIVIELAKDLISQGAQGVILGCTELGLLIKGEIQGVPTFDTTQMHAEDAAHQALSANVNNSTPLQHSNRRPHLYP